MRLLPYWAHDLLSPKPAVQAAGVADDMGSVVAIVLTLKVGLKPPSDEVYIGIVNHVTICSGKQRCAVMFTIDGRAARASASDPATPGSSE